MANTDIAKILDDDSITESRDLVQLAQTVDIVRLRAEGKSHDEISTILHIPLSKIADHIKLAMRTILRENGAEEMRAIELTYLDKATQRLLPYIDPDTNEETIIISKNGVPIEVKIADLPPNPQLIDSFLKVSKSKRDLVGADAAQKVTINLDEGEMVEALDGRLSRLERLNKLTDHIAQSGIGSGQVNDDEIVDAELIEDDSANNDGS